MDVHSPPPRNPITPFICGMYRADNQTETDKTPIKADANITNDSRGHSVDH
jgi:hypothetical protein